MPVKTKGIEITVKTGKTIYSYLLNKNSVILRSMVEFVKNALNKITYK